MSSRNATVRALPFLLSAGLFLNTACFQKQGNGTAATPGPSAMPSAAQPTSGNSPLPTLAPEAAFAAREKYIKEAARLTNEIAAAYEKSEAREKITTLEKQAAELKAPPSTGLTDAESEKLKALEDQLLQPAIERLRAAAIKAHFDNLGK